MKTSSPLAVAMGVVVALGITGFVRASSEAQEERAWDFVRKASEERKRLGIKDYAAATRQFPTPEVRFTRKPPAACPGEKVALKATGRIPARAGVFVLSDGVVVGREALTTSSWEAEVEVKKDALPEPVSVRFVSPVSGSYETLHALDIACTYRWVLTLEGGERLTVTTAWGPDALLRAEGEWSRGGQRTPVEVEARRAGDGRFTFTRLTTSEEAQAEATAFDEAMRSPEWAKLDARQTAALARFEACQKKPPAEMGTCMKAPADEMKRIGDERSELLARRRDQSATAAGVPGKVGCEVIEVRAAPGGKLTGKGDRCADSGPRKVTGTVEPAR